MERAVNSLHFVYASISVLLFVDDFSFIFFGKPVCRVHQLNLTFCEKFKLIEQNVGSNRHLSHLSPSVFKKSVRTGRKTVQYGSDLRTGNVESFSQFIKLADREKSICGHIFSLVCMKSYTEI